MSDYRFGDDYKLSIYPKEAMGYDGLDMDKVKSVEIEWVDFIRKPDDKSRWFDLFGTPEKAAQTLETVAENLFSRAWSDDNATLSDVTCSLAAHCEECPAMGLPGRGVSRICGEVDYDALLEWLGGDA